MQDAAIAHHRGTLRWVSVESAPRIFAVLKWHFFD
jgi:hypothetical protein